MKPSVLVLPLALLACSAQAQSPPEVARFAAAARASTIAALKDPRSVQLRGLFVSRGEYQDKDGTDPKQLWLCGEVNAKNSYGGYSGFQRFASNGAGPVIEGLETSEAFDVIVWQRRCGDKVRDIR